MSSPLTKRLIIAGVPLLVVGVGIVGCLRRVPEIRGRIVDARTGAPIAGALVQRYCYSTPPFNLVDTREEELVGGSFAEARSDASGRFTLPALTAYKLVAMRWVSFAPGYMPGEGCYHERGWFAGGCGYGGVMTEYDPWVTAAFSRRGGVLELQVRAFPPTLEGLVWRGVRSDASGARIVETSPPSPPPDPWGEYFRRASIFVQMRYLPVDEFVKEAVRYVRQRTVTEEAFGMICRFTSDNYLGSHRDGSPCYKGESAWTMLEIQEQVCRKHPDWCNAEGLASTRRYLEANCEYLRRNP